MNKIPNGYKLVPVEPTSEMVLAGINTELVETGDEDFDEQEDYRRVWRSMVEDAPAPPQPIYDEAKERELFEVHYRDQFEAETGRELSDDDIKSLRDGPLYGKSRTYLNGQWVGWKACVQSSAKAVEVGHE